MEHLYILLISDYHKNRLTHKVAGTDNLVTAVVSISNNILLFWVYLHQLNYFTPSYSKDRSASVWSRSETESPAEIWQMQGIESASLKGVFYIYSAYFSKSSI